MKRFARVCIGATALATGVALAPLAMASAAAQSSPGTRQVHGRSLEVSAHRVVSFRLAGHAAATRHPALATPLRYYNASRVAAQRAAAVSSGGRRSGLVALAPSRTARESVTPPSTLAHFPAMNMNRQVSDFGSADEALQPPDTQVAAGPSVVLEAVNDSLSVWSKTGTLLADADANAFFQVPSGYLFSDPRVLYDSPSGRWILSGFSFDSSNDSETYLAVSVTSDPTGIWNIYTVQSNTSGNVTDQPMTGVCNDKVVMSWNLFNGSSTFVSAQTLVLQKSQLLAGSFPVSSTQIDTTDFRLVPAQNLSPSSTCWLTGNDADPATGAVTTSPTLNVAAITGTPVNRNVTMLEEYVPVTATNPPPAPAQPSGTTNNTLNDDRLLSAVWQNGVLWTSGTDACTPAGDTVVRNCMRLFEASTTGTSPEVVQDFDLSASGVDEYYPAVSLSNTGDLFVSYSASSSSPTGYPGAYAVVSPSVAANQTPPPFTSPVTIQAGAASYNGGTNARWGDYSAAAPDPSQPGAVWVAAEYAPSDAGTGNWGTAAAELTLSSAPSIAVGAEGGDGQLWAQAPQLGGGWHPLGGKIVAPPAVAAAPNPDGSAPAQPLFIATGTDKHLYIRSLSLGWQLLGPSTASCLGGPAAVITAGTLTVACEGTDRGLWVNSTPVTTATLPHFYSGWKPLGGVLSAGPAVAPVGSTMTFFVRGTNGHVYIRTLAAGYTAMPWVCIGAPAAAQEPAGGETIFACQGTNHALYEATNWGSGWTSAVSQGGSLIGGPAVAATSRVPELLAEGTNRAVWLRTPSGWSSLGGVVVGGVGAVALN